jgi:hypothetical protein
MTHVKQITFINSTLVQYHDLSVYNKKFQLPFYCNSFFHMQTKVKYNMTYTNVSRQINAIKKINSITRGNITWYDRLFQNMVMFLSLKTFHQRHSQLVIKLSRGPRGLLLTSNDDINVKIAYTANDFRQNGNYARTQFLTWSKKNINYFQILELILNRLPRDT